MFKTITTAAVLAAWCFVAQAADETVTGRYVNVSIPGNGKTLSLAEVQVYSDGKNVAQGQKTVQTNIGSGGDSSRGVDGRTNGDWGSGTITHTAEGTKDPAREVDLGKDIEIEKIVIWNRDGFEYRLYGCRVTVLDKKRKAVWGVDIAKPGSGATELPISEYPDCKWSGDKIAKITQRSGGGGGSKTDIASNTRESLRLAINDLIASFGASYPNGKDYLARLDALDEADTDGLEALRREALLANPLLDFDKLLLVRRKGNIGLPANWQGNSSVGKTGYDNEIAVLEGLDDGELKTLYKPDGTQFVGDVDLHFDADKMLFSSIAPNDSWAVYEINADGTGLRQVSPDMGQDIDNYDAIYLPSGKIIFDSTAGYTGVPCVGGNDFVGNLHVMDADGSNIRRLCFEQDNDWYPVMMNNGRVMFLRWEYTDSAHYFARVTMHMNPDGTDQRGYYGSNSYWPNSLFYARPVPGSVTKFVGIVSGHHGVRRAGPLVLFDVSKGRHEV
ncbi:MAG TPA: hypothetical protein VE890_00545, partial [Thermoguttaceae bacterium]|nr:hypothetical protein [Thermoguttaceae bacterium]